MKRYKYKEHRLVYEQFHKLCLLPWAEVHHVNGNTLDNRPDNLIASSGKLHRIFTQQVEYLKHEDLPTCLYRGFKESPRPEPMGRVKFFGSVSRLGNGYYIRIPRMHRQAARRGWGKQVIVSLDDEI